MSQFPPNDPTPPQYAAYQRPNDLTYGSADKLQALSDGYFGLNNIFFINIAIVLGIRAAIGGLATPDNLLFMYVGAFLVVGLVVGFGTYPFNKKIGYGADWNPGMPLLASILMGINSALCCGILGYVVVQMIAAKEIRKYGVKAGFFGLKKKDIALVISRMRTQQAAPPYSPPPSGG